MTKKREEFTSEIRRANKEDFFRKKRSKVEDFTPLNNDIEMKNYIESCMQKTFSLDDFRFLVDNINSSILRNEYLGVIGLRKLLSIENHPPIQAVIDANLLPKFIEFMSRNDQPSLQLESTWSLTNIATGNSFHIQSIVERGGLAAIIKVVNSTIPELVDQVKSLKKFIRKYGF